jgi:glutathione S-transferase
MMKLCWSDVLSPRKACAVAKYLNAPVEYVYIDLTKGDQRTPTYLSVNPNGKVPTLIDGDRIVLEADAIICHLSQKTGADLWPNDGARQIEILSWFSWAGQHLNHACGTLYFENIIKKRFGIGKPDKGTVERAQDGFRRFAAVLDLHLREHQWLVGEALSVADFSVAIALPYATDAAIPLDEFENVRRWHDRLNELDAWRDPFPAR